MESRGRIIAVRTHWRRFERKPDDAARDARCLDDVQTFGPAPPVFDPSSVATIRRFSATMAHAVRKAGCLGELHIEP